MEFEWDEEKNLKNIEKHGVRFEDACKIFEGFTLDIADTRFDYGEERIISIGTLRGTVVLTVIHTDRMGNLRMISARPAKRSERRLYDQALQQSFDS
jgi:uncharacterized DUF497 family protein